MSRTTLSVQAETVAGISPTMTAPHGAGTGNGNTFAHTNAAPAVLIIKNADSAPHTITIPANGVKFHGVTVADHVQAIAAGAIAVVHVPPDVYSTAGICAVDIEDATSVTWAAVKNLGSVFS